MNPSTRTAKDTMNAVLMAQQSGQYVEWRPLHTRVCLAGLANATTGLLSESSPIALFSKTQGQTGQGFSRVLTDADTWLRSGEAQMPAGQEAVAFSMGAIIAPEAPEWIKRSVIYYATLNQKRGPTTYEFGGVGDWPAGNYGNLASAAATGEAVTYFRSTNGLGNYRQFVDNALVALPAKQPIEFYLNLRRSFYCTTNGAAVGVGGSTLLPSTYSPPSAAWVNDFNDEVCSTFRLVLWGYIFSLPG